MEVFQILLIDLSLTCLKGGIYCANEKMKTRMYAAPAVKGLKSYLI